MAKAVGAGLNPLQFVVQRIKVPVADSFDSATGTFGAAGGIRNHVRLPAN